MLSVECQMTVPGHIRHYISIVTCISALVCLAVSIDYTQCTVIGRPLAEVRAALISALFLRHRLSGDLCEGFYFPGPFQLNLCWTLFSGKSPPPITGWCTPLIGRWKRSFGFQGWCLHIHVEPSLLASMEMHYNHPESVQKLSI